MKFQEPKFIPLFIHNLKNFDSNLILKSLKSGKFEKCRVIPKSTEKYLSFSLDEIRLLDSYQFLSFPLAVLVDNLRHSGVESFNITQQIFKRKYKDFNEEKMKLLLRKGVFCYEFINTFKQLEMKFLPSIDFFYSSLNFSMISEDDYQHAKNVYQAFKCENIREYLELYVLLDTCLLGDVITKFRDKIFNIYQLEACHFFSLPTLSFQAMLKLTEVEIELFIDPEMYLFIENSIRGGIVQVAKRYSRSNNKYLKKNFNRNQTSSYLIYLDGISNINIL